jgi:dCMP deaminase
MTRPNWDEYFMKITDMVAERGTCDRGKSGAVIVVDKRIVSTGYVGSPPSQPHCDEVGHLMRDVIDEEGNKSKHCIRTVHAEENAILQAARYGISLKGGTIYCKMTPCFNCAKMIVSVGINRVVAKKRYHAEALSVELFKKANIELKIVEDKFEEYKNQ